MQIHATIKVASRVTLEFNDPEDIRALREMAQVVAKALHREVAHGPCSHDTAVAYALAGWLLDRVPEPQP
jgi:hypothetical protein